MMTYEQLVDELHEHSADELRDLAEIAKRIAIQHRREEILKNANESRADYLAGRLDEPTDDMDELMRRFKKFEESE
ncbi:MAG TPA: hypothetical protein VFD13_09275 [Candidatus Kapabacteria bacterium]|nr:hypothetical protein [Candidatus Kapabacteria bacterium]